ncbi:MAG: hypothetical protein AABZ60_20575 [Planctomycetota bacterium]
MGFFQDYFERRKLENLEARVRKNPTPAAYYDFCQQLHSQEKYEQALNWAQDGIQRFSDASQLLTFQGFLKKEAFKHEITELQNQLKLNPTAKIYNRLAEIYLDLDNESKASEYVELCQAKFPEDEGPYLLYGLIRYRRYLKDFLLKDGLKAIEYLENACNLNQRNYRALSALGELYLTIGAINQAKEKFKNILQFAPEDTKAKELLKIARSRPEPKNEEIEELLKKTETMQASANIKPKKIYTPEEFEQKLQSFQKYSNLEHAMFINIQGTILGSIQGASKTTKEVFATILIEIYKTSQISSQRMDIGNLQNLHIEGPFGTIFIHIVAEETLLAVLVSKAGKVDFISKEILRIAGSF